MRLEEPTLQDSEVRLPRWIGVLHLEQFAHIRPIISVVECSSTVCRFKRLLSLVLRYTRNCGLKPECRRRGPLEVTDLEEALRVVSVSLKSTRC